MTENIIGHKNAAKLIGCEPASLAYWIDVGDILPTPDLATWSTHDGKIYRDYKLLELTLEDIERYKIEMRRRSFADFKNEYADVYTPDVGPQPRGLEFGPGWENILREFCDGLREFQSAGYRASLRWGKEKCGALKLFTDHADEIAAYVSEQRGKAYGRSLGTCQECGAPARLRWGDAICQTLCDRHKHIVGEPDPDKDGIILDVSAWTREQGRIAE